MVPTFTLLAVFAKALRRTPHALPLLTTDEDTYGS
jgi:hypothetical protein